MIQQASLLKSWEAAAPYLLLLNFSLTSVLHSFQCDDHSHSDWDLTTQSHPNFEPKFQSKLFSVSVLWKIFHLSFRRLSLSSVRRSRTKIATARSFVPALVHTFLDSLVLCGGEYDDDVNQTVGQCAGWEDWCSSSSSSSSRSYCRQFPYFSCFMSCCFVAKFVAKMSEIWSEQR